MKDRLYLFQCYPQITTTLTFAEYTDDSRTATKEVTPGLSEVMMLAGAKTPTEYAIEEIDPYMLRERFKPSMWKHRTSPAVNADRTSTSSPMESALSRWKN